MSARHWREHAACRVPGEDRSAPFFEPFSAETGKLVDEPALNEARKLCHDCPVRRACLGDIAEYELGLETVNRSGLAAYLSPGQRESAEKRGILRCPRCDAWRDPVLLEKGILRCPRRCGERTRRIPALPHEGDQWTKRHTTLSQRIVGWVLDNTSMGDGLPTPTRMAELLGGVRRSDVLRVYAAMTADGTIRRDDQDYVRVGSTGVLRRWWPAFLPKD
ncbi:MAG TPA: WhiB family transcriptional regulator [Verrucomicrobiae bacterium]|nr:WhiB family transcriptional regulator [Verrucomicrobiae bacterium]